MKIFIDTNVLISAILYPDGITNLAYTKAVSYPNVGIILTGDKDFLESGISTPKIVNPSNFISDF